MNSVPSVDFFVIGAQKCATSWLYLCLRDHPGVSLHAKKDEANYIGGPRYRERGPEWFAGLYPPQATGEIRGAVSVDYLYDQQALAFVLRHYPDAHFVVCLRNPLDRFASAQSFLARKGLLPDEPLDTSVRHALAASDSGSLRAELIQRGLYARQLQPLAEHIHAGRLLAIGYETLCAEPETTLRQLYAFLGAAPSFIPPSYALRPKRNANVPALIAIERLAPGSRVLGKIMDHANQWACRLRLNRAAPPLPAEVEAALRQRYAADVQHLDELLERLPPDRMLFTKPPSEAWGFRP